MLKNKDEIVANGRLKGPKNEIWWKLKETYGINKTPKALYTCVKCNRWNLKEDLGLIELSTAEQTDIHFEENIAIAQECTSDSDESGIKSDDLDDFTIPNQTLEDRHSTAIEIFIPKEKWRAIEPEEKIYMRNVKYLSST